MSEESQAPSDAEPQVVDDLPPPEVLEKEVAVEEHRALGWAALLAAIAIGWMVMPVGVGILLGALLAFMLQPFFEKLVPRIGAAWSALLVVVGTSLFMAGTIGGLASLFVAKGTTLTKTLIQAIGPDGPGGGLLKAISKLTQRVGLSTDDLIAKAQSYAEGALDRAEDVAATIASATASAMLGLFFMMMAMHYVLRNWQTVTTRAQDAFPLRPDYTAALFSEFRRVGKTTLLGTIVTGVAQGVLATIGFWMTGVPEPIFFGAATAIASLIPAVGTMLIWVPAGVSLIVLGHTTAGVLELVWGGVFVVGVADYVIRPRLVSEGDVPSLVTFAALFGGVEVFGLKGLILGPVLMSLAFAVLRLYANETRKRREASQPEVAHVQIGARPSGKWQAGTPKSKD